MPGGKVKLTLGVTLSRARAERLTAVLIAASILAGCSGVPIPPTSTDDELRAICERHSGWWRGGYCEYDSHL